MATFIFVEGVDGSGKTTVCNKLKREGYFVVDIERETENQINLYDHLRRYDGIVVFDRSFLSEIVYRMIDGEPSQWLIDDVTKYLEDVAIGVIHCVSDTAFDDSLKRGESDVLLRSTSEKIKNIYNVFLKCLETLDAIDLIEYDWHKDDFQKVLDFIKEEE